jgi:tetratricopeptide (TPR) repeat protein
MMPEEEPEEKTQSHAEPFSDASSPPAAERPQRAAITPELRRFLGPARSLHERPATEEKSSDLPTTIEKTPLEKPGREEPKRRRQKSKRAEETRAEQTLPVLENEELAKAEPEPRIPARSSKALVPNWKLWRAAEMQNVALIIGGLFLLLVTFYVGKKFEYWKYRIATWNKPKLSGVSDKYPGASSEQLIDQALAAERLGNWHEAVERFLSAKQKNLTYRGLLFRTAKLCYDHRDFESADKLFERASAFGENVDTANHFRALIAVGRNDYPAAERFFEAAARAEPFLPGYYYYWAETLRRDRHPKEAMQRYEQAAARTSSQQDVTVCQFKIRMARLEAGDTAGLDAEIEEKYASAPLSVDWLLTEAALKIRQGHIAEAVPLIDNARVADEKRLFSLFSSCTGDMLFSEACRNHPEVAQACRVANPPSLTVP